MERKRSTLCDTVQRSESTPTSLSKQIGTTATLGALYAAPVTGGILALLCGYASWHKYTTYEAAQYVTSVVLDTIVGGLAGNAVGAFGGACYGALIAVQRDSQRK